MFGSGICTELVTRKTSRSGWPHPHKLTLPPETQGTRRYTGGSRSTRPHAGQAQGHTGLARNSPLMASLFCQRFLALLTRFARTPKRVSATPFHVGPRRDQAELPQSCVDTAWHSHTGTGAPPQLRRRQSTRVLIDSSTSSPRPPGITTLRASRGRLVLTRTFVRSTRSPLCPVLHFFSPLIDSYHFYRHD